MRINISSAVKVEVKKDSRWLARATGLVIPGSLDEQVEVYCRKCLSAGDNNRFESAIVAANPAVAEEAVYAAIDAVCNDPI